MTSQCHVRMVWAQYCQILAIFQPGDRVRLLSQKKKFQLFTPREAKNSDLYMKSYHFKRLAANDFFTKLCSVMYPKRTGSWVATSQPLISDRACFVFLRQLVWQHFSLHRAKAIESGPKEKALPVLGEIWTASHP